MDTKGRGVGGIERLGSTYIHCILCRFSRVQLLTTQWAVAGQAPLSTGFSRQEYWSKLSCPPPWDLPDPGIEATSLMSPALAGRFFTTSATWEAHIYTAAKSLQSCPTLCHPIDGSPPGSSIPGIFQARVLEWGAIAFSNIYTTIYKIDN